jgi:hypothetical protein
VFKRWRIKDAKRQAVTSMVEDEEGQWNKLYNG